MTKRLLPILTREEAEAILVGLEPTPERSEDRGYYVRFLPLVVASAARAGWIDLLPAIRRAIDNRETYCDESDEVFFEAITSGLTCRGAVDSLVKRALRSDVADLVRALVSGLDLADPAARKLLLKGARSPKPDLQYACKRRLEPLGLLHWWEGIFSHDPAQMVGPEALEAVDEALQRCVDAIDGPEELGLEWFEDIKKLPLPLAKDLWVRQLKGLPEGICRLSPAVVMLALDLPDVLPEFFELAENHFDDWRYLAGPVLRYFEPEVAAAHGLRLAAYALENENTPERKDSAIWAAEQVMGAWPESQDPTPLVQLLTPTDEPSEVRRALTRGALRAADWLVPWAEYLIAALLDNNLRALSVTGGAWGEVFESFDEMEEDVLRALSSPHPTARVWGLGWCAKNPSIFPDFRQLIRDAAQDPNVGGVVAEAFSEYLEDIPPRARKSGRQKSYR